MVQTASEPVIPLPRVLKAAKAGPAPRVNLVILKPHLDTINRIHPLANPAVDMHLIQQPHLVRVWCQQPHNVLSLIDQPRARCNRNAGL